MILLDPTWLFEIENYSPYRLIPSYNKTRYGREVILEGISNDSQIHLTYTTIELCFFFFSGK